MERLPSLFKPINNYPFSFDPSKMNDITRRILGSYKALGRNVKEARVQIASSSIFPIEDKEEKTGI